LSDLLRFDLGISVVQRVPAVEIVASRIPYTLTLTAGALAIAVGIGVPVGIAMAVWRGRTVERLLAAVVLTGQSTPTFLSGVLMILLFAVVLGWLPASGADGPASLVLPSIALGALSLSTFARMARIAVVDELGKDYVRAGRARGLSLGGVVARHVLRNAAIPVITLAGDEIAGLVNGSVVIEVIFGWPGIGLLAINAIERRDFTLIQADVLIVATLVVLINLAVDLTYAYLDPRIRYS
jgi:peptide/nickel transport system permease protein